VARIKVAYLGGASTRAPGTVGAFVARGAAFAGSEIALVDLDPERLDVVRRIGERMARARDVDLVITATTDRRAGLQDADIVLSSFRPGGLEARVLDERIPLRHGVIGQETQGPGGFFMALRSVHILGQVIEEMAVHCPRARIVNYTNPVNIVAQAVADHAEVPIVSLCEGPEYFPREVARAAGLDPERVTATMVGLNHNCWSVEEAYDGGPLLPLVEEAWEREREREQLPSEQRRLLRLAAVMGSLPADYFLLYYYRDEILAELRAKPTTRAEDILRWSPGYWAHYREQAEADEPALDPARSRGGIDELELAVAVIDAVANDAPATVPVNVPNRGALPGFPDDLVVEVPGRVDADWVTPLPVRGLPRHVRGLVEVLAEYQLLAAEVAWSGTRRDGIRALASHPLVPSLPVAEALFDEMAWAHREHLPDRLLR
jgi:6-phospho-beta-glucosidase